MNIDKEWFWNNVALMAKNNYGSWNNEPMTARIFIDKAIDAVSGDIADMAMDDQENILNILVDMVPDDSKLLEWAGGSEDSHD